MALESDWEIAVDNGMWLTHPSHLNVNKKKNSGSVLNRRKHTKIVRPGDGWLNWETPDKSGRLGRYAIDTVVNCICDRFQWKDYIETVHKMETNTVSKALREEDFGPQFQHISLFFLSDFNLN